MKKELQDEMFEAMLRSALRDHREEELLTEEKLRAQGEEHQFSPEFERKMEKLIKKMRRKERRKSHQKRFHHVAAVFVAVILAGSVMVTKVEAIRAPIMNIIITMGERCAEIRLQEQAEKQAVSEKYDDHLPQYIVPGFCIETVREEADQISVRYMAEDESGSFYSLTFASVPGSASYDTEDAVVTEIAIQGYPAVLIEKTKNEEAYTQVVWFPDGGEYHISGYITAEEAVQVLESVVIGELGG